MKDNEEKHTINNCDWWITSCQNGYIISFSPHREFKNIEHCIVFETRENLVEYLKNELK